MLNKEIRTKIKTDNQNYGIKDDEEGERKIKKLQEQGISVSQTKR